MKMKNASKQIVIMAGRTENISMKSLFWDMLDRDSKIEAVGIFRSDDSKIMSKTIKDNLYSSLERNAKLDREKGSWSDSYSGALKSTLIGMKPEFRVPVVDHSNLESEILKVISDNIVDNCALFVDLSGLEVYDSYFTVLALAANVLIHNNATVYVEGYGHSCTKALEIFKEIVLLHNKDMHL